MADTAEVPLIANRNDIAGLDDDVDLDDVDLLLEKNLKHPGRYVWLLTFAAGISGLLFGCRCPCAFYLAFRILLSSKVVFSAWKFSIVER